MTTTNRSTFVTAGIWALLVGVTFASDRPDFNRDVRPILSGRCFKCHGPDPETREAGLRLDTFSGATTIPQDGTAAIIPHKPEAGSLIDRIRSSDPDLRMPPPSEGPGLTDAEIQTLQRWIKSGAGYDRHWSYVAPVRPLPPAVKSTTWSRNPIDRFVLAKLEVKGLQPQPQADPATLLRRVTIDLTGLPPTLEETEAFLASPGDDAYEQVVDRLLASPAYGERFARMWLDLARYADSAGYADDPPRTIWMYRDWVIDALNSGMPFDQFTIEQLAGDLLESPTESQRIATGFHRNTMTNSEGGTDDEEFRTVAIVDRVNTTMQTWMATTIMCAQCHTHKYDPITQAEYYQLYAILNQTEDADRRDEAPYLSILTPELQQKSDALKAEITEHRKKLEARSKELSVEIPVSQPVRGRYLRIEMPGQKKILSLAEVQVFSRDQNIALGKSASQSSTAYEGPAALAIDGNTNGHFFEAKSTTHTATEDNPWWEVDLAEETELQSVVLWNRSDSPGIGNRLAGAVVVLLDSDRQPRWTTRLNKAPQPDVRIPLPESTDKFSKDDRELLTTRLTAGHPELVQLQNQIASLEKQQAAIQPVTTPVMVELPADKQRTTRIQIRGNFMDLGDEVQPGTPAVFPPLEEGRANRLAIARWLVRADNPLTSRVLVNRLWEQLFGIGLVETSEEFGLQGELPSHPELLDWLAVETVEREWDIKQMIRLIVTSSTYRQSSTAPQELVATDPDNRLLARGPRFRLEAELVRDHALAAGGLLSRKMHGPSAKPPRPRLGLTAAFGASTDWETSSGEDRYRRGIYTFWQRSMPYPSMDTFDAPNREVCTVRRTRTNTPLQALVTLNDPVYVEAAHALAGRVLKDPKATTGSLKDLLSLAFRICLTRSPSASELQVLGESHGKIRSRFQANPAEAQKLLEGLAQVEAVDPVDLATWTVMSNILLNLDETLTRR